jgi:hypothetical protein
MAVQAFILGQGAADRSYRPWRIAGLAHLMRRNTLPHFAS